jgi:hypothetical protein
VGRGRPWSRWGWTDTWSEAAIERTARALAAWARKAQSPDWDPERHGQYANLIANLGPAEKRRRVTYELERARRAFWWQRMIDLADARGYPLAVVDRAERLLSALAAEGGRDAPGPQHPDRRGDG